MDIKQRKHSIRLLKSLIAEGKKFTFENFSSREPETGPKKNSKKKPLEFGGKDTPDWHCWKTACHHQVQKLAEVNPLSYQFITEAMGIPTASNPHGHFDLAKAKFLKALKMTLEAITKDDSEPIQEDAEIVKVLDRLLRRFHLFARQLQNRRADRLSLVIRDEYDVQYLLHALLKIHFDDIRPEENTPSYAGGSSRVDFLLKAERTVVEAKIATAKLRDRQIGEQLIIDIQRYQSHQDCETLVCFIYDPGGFLKNPTGLTNDLSRKKDRIVVKVIIVP